MLKIRLARTGANKKSSYRIVVIDRENARDGRFVEILGHFNARRTPPELVFNQDRMTHWLSKGAQPSDTVRSFLKQKPAPAAAAKV